MNLVKWFLCLIYVTKFIPAENAPAALNIVPRPVNVRYSTGTFILSNRTRIVASDAESRRIAESFNQFLLDQHGIRLKFATATSAGNDVISFSQQGSQDLPAEGYRLSIRPKTIRVIGRHAGLFYGMQSLVQLLPLGRCESRGELGPDMNPGYRRESIAPGRN